ncbi:MAG: hypothetical protein IJT25_03420 [Clostridia bacterium]|nr:hypothetical protein [Clostridia bacterium]
MKKSSIINIVFNVLGKAFGYVCKNDKRAKDLFFALPKHLTINMGIYGESTYISLEKTENQILKVKPTKENADLEVLFKTRYAARLVLLGKISVSESFARHDILLKGDINTAVRLVRIINIIEYYLFPRIITYKFLPKMQKEISSFKVYGFTLFGNSKNCKIDNFNAKIKNVTNKNAEKHNKDTDGSDKNLEKLQNVEKVSEKV